jgi:hypothetical protein
MQAFVFSYEDSTSAFTIFAGYVLLARFWALNYISDGVYRPVGSKAPTRPE